MITFDAQKLAAVAIAQGIEETRYYLCGVYFEGSVAVATDGHMLTAGYDATADNESGIYPVSKKAITAMKKKTATNVVIENDQLQVNGEYDAVLHIEPCKAIDGTFPDWRRVLPDEIGTASNAAFGEAILTRIATTAKILGKSAILITGNDASSPHWVGYNNDHDVFTVVMPMRSILTTEKPDWINPKKLAA